MLPLAFAAFVVFGVVLVLVGANQAELAAALSLDLESSGLLGAALSLGIGFGVLSSGPLVDRGRRRPLFVVASAGAAVLLASVGPELDFQRAVATVAGLGVCVGAYETILNTVVAERYGAAAARPLTAVHIGATVGAVLGAPALAALTARAGWAASFQATSVAFVVLGVWALRVPLERPAPPPASDGAPSGRLSSAIVPYALAIGCYVGVETALTLFAVPWSRDALGLGAGRGVSSISAFWLGLLAGRLLFALRERAARAGVVVASGVAGGALLAAAASFRLPYPELVLAVVGAALGVVFPLVVALTALRFPAARGTATGLVTGAGAAGGFVVPWLAGAVGDRAGVNAVFFTLALVCAVLAMAAAAVRRSERSRVR